MDQTDRTSTAAIAVPRRLGALWTIAALVLAGCQSMAPLPEPRIEPMDEPLARPAPPPEPRPAPRRVLLVLAEEQASLQAVIDEISGKLPAAEFDAVSLAGATVLPEHALRRIDRNEYAAAVAVGHGAGIALIGQAVETRVFCQVFDSRELTADGMAGVALLPSPGQSLAAWKRLSPQLHTIGVLTGTGMEGLAAEIAADARDLGLELIHREVESDQAFFQAFRALSRKIDGLLLIPDHRVLSPAIIGDLFAYAEKRSVQVLAFTPSFLELGAVAFSVNEPGDVASRVLSLLEDAELYESMQGRVLPLTLARIETDAGAVPPAAMGIGRHAHLE